MIDCTDEQLMEEVRRRGFVIRDAQIEREHKACYEIPDWKPGMVFPAPEREWVGLTVKEVLELLPSSKWKAEETLLFVQRIEAKLKEKNGG